MVIAHYSSLNLARHRSLHDSHHKNSRYFTMSRYLRRLGHSYIIITKDTPYLGNRRFAHYYQIMNAVGRLKLFDQPIKVDSIFNKGRIPKHPNLPLVINSHKFIEIGDSKIRQAQIFAKLVPKTFVARSHKQALDYLRRHQDQLLVIKPDNLSGGRGIQFVDDAAKLIVDEKHCRLPFVIQEFVESELGVPNLVTGRHDLRVYMLNDQPICMSIRQPSPGGFLANTHQGGSIEFYPLEAVPSPVRKLCQQIDQALKQTGPRYYSSDFMRDHLGHWRLIEINARPGIPASDVADARLEAVQKQIAFFLLRSTQHRQALDKKLYKALKGAKTERRLLRSTKSTADEVLPIYRGIDMRDISQYRHNLATFKKSIPDIPSKTPPEITLILQAIYHDLADNNLLRLKLLSAAQTDKSHLQARLFQTVNQDLYGSLDRQLWQGSLNSLLGKHPAAANWRRRLQLSDNRRLKQSLPDTNKLNFMVRYLELDRLTEQMRASHFAANSNLKIFQTVLANVCHLPGWQAITRSGRTSASIAYAQRRIMVPPQVENYSKRRIRKMVIHEIGVHIQRHLLTRLVPIKAFRMGLPGYEPFEEGLAVILAGYLNKQPELRSRMLYVALGLALGLDGHPRNYSQTQDLLEQIISLNHRPDYAKRQAQAIASRIFRGTDHQTPGTVFLADKKYLEGIAIATDLINACHSSSEVVKLLRYRYNPLDANQRQLVDWLDSIH